MSRHNNRYGSDCSSPSCSIYIFTRTVPAVTRDHPCGSKARAGHGPEGCKCYRPSRSSFPRGTYPLAKTRPDHTKDQPSDSDFWFPDPDHMVRGLVPRLPAAFPSPLPVLDMVCRGGRAGTSSPAHTCQGLGQTGGGCM